MGTFLEKQKLLKQMKEEMDDLITPVLSKETALVIKSCPQRKSGLIWLHH